MNHRDKYPTRKILLRTDVQRQTAMRVIENAPLDDARPLEFLLREEVKVRKLDQNALYWSGPLRDIAEQAYVKGRQYSAEVWAEFFKREFLPEEFDPELCKEGYRKWEYLPSGERALIGSTTQLTVRGFAQYLTQVEAYGAQELAVTFHANPRESREAA